MVSQIPKAPKYVDPKPIGQVQRLPYMLQIERQQPPCPNISHLKFESGSPRPCSKGSELLEDPHKLIKSVDLRCQTVFFFIEGTQLHQMVFGKHFMLVALDV